MKTDVSQLTCFQNFHLNKQIEYKLKVSLLLFIHFSCLKILFLSAICKNEISFGKY